MASKNISAKEMTNVEIVEIIAELRRMRIEKEISQRQVAKYLGITLAALCHYELLRRSPKISELKKWAEYLGFYIHINLIKKGITYGYPR
jgi:transcriptional regulator with XRE-family HTH domain